MAVLPMMKTKAVQKCTICNTALVGSISKSCAFTIKHLALAAFHPVPFIFGPETTTPIIKACFDDCAAYDLDEDRKTAFP